MSRGLSTLKAYMLVDSQSNTLEFKKSSCLLVNDVDDALLDEHVGNNDLGAVDEDIVTINGDGEGAVGQRSQHRAVCEQGRVSNDIGDDVIAKNASELLHRDVRQGRTNSLEGCIVGDEGGQVGWERSTGNSGPLKCTYSRGLVQGN